MIRPYCSKDRIQLIELLRLNIPEYFDPSEEKEFLKYLDEDSHNYFIIEKGNDIIGSGGCNYGFDEGKTARIAWGMIHPEWQGKGIGTKLTLYRINRIKRNPGVNKIVVRTTQMVFPFYQKVGFELEEIIEDYWAEGFHLYQLKIDLN